MTDELPAEQEAVRRLLAQARHDGPIPSEVADRLEVTLTELRDGTRTRPSRMAAALTDLNAVRRRRRNAGRVLFAAAAVVFGGVALGQSVDGIGGNADSAESATSAEADLAEVPRDGTLTAENDDKFADESDQGGVSDSTSGQESSGDALSAPSPADIDAAQLLAEVRLPARLTSADFASDVTGLFRRATDEREAAARQRLDLTKQYADASEYTCESGPYGRGALLPVYYDGVPAVLALRPPQGANQQVDLLACGSGIKLDRVTLSRE